MGKNKKLAILIIIVTFIVLIAILIKTDLPNKVFNLNGDVSSQNNETMFLTGNEINSKIKLLGGASLDPFWKMVKDDWKNEKITKIKRSKTIQKKYKIKKNIVSTSDSKKPIYMWYSNKVIYYYTEATKIYLNPNSSQMFSYLTKLTSIDLSEWDASKVTNMESMFFHCYSLKKLNLSKWNTSSVTNMGSMFSNCSSLASLNLSSFNTSNVTNMESMFHGCHKLTKLNLSSFDTSKVTSIAQMFGAYTSNDKMNLTTITGIDKFNTSNVTNMERLFWNCYKLTSLNLSKWNTSKVTSMGSMFNGCEKLTSLNISKWDTSNVTDMSLMFEECKSLTSLNLRSFNTSKVTNMERMFYFCIKLNRIYVGAGFTTSKVSLSNSMFGNCTSLIGEQGTKYSNISNVQYDVKYENKTYAHVDKGTSSPGYFSAIYKINYHGNGGLYNNSETYLDSRIFRYNEVYPNADSTELIRKNMFKRKGYKFTGWTTKKGYAGWTAGYKGDSDRKWKWGNGQYGIGDEYSYQLDLYAQWKLVTYTIKFNANGGTGTMADQQKTYGVKTKAPTNKFKRKGYKFVGWNTKADGSGTSFKPNGTIGTISKVDGSIHTLYAQWKKIK